MSERGAGVGIHALVLLTREPLGIDESRFSSESIIYLLTRAEFVIFWCINLFWWLQYMLMVVQFGGSLNENKGATHCVSVFSVVI